VGADTEQGGVDDGVDAVAPPPPDLDAEPPGFVGHHDHVLRAERARPRHLPGTHRRDGADATVAGELEDETRRPRPPPR
jgi:hypothetical protein